LPEEPEPEDDGKELNEGTEEEDDGGKAEPEESEGEEGPPEEEKADDDSADDEAKDGDSKDDEGSGGRSVLVPCSLDGECVTKDGEVCSPMYSNWGAGDETLEGSFCTTSCDEFIEDADRSLYVDCPVPSLLVDCGSGADVCDADSNELCVPMLLQDADGA